MHLGSCTVDVINIGQATGVTRIYLLKKKNNAFILMHTNLISLELLSFFGHVLMKTLSIRSFKKKNQNSAMTDPNGQAFAVNLVK